MGFKWHLTAELGETCLIPPWWGQRGQVMFARCGTLNSLEFFFSMRNTMCGGSAWLKTEMSDCHAQCVPLESPVTITTATATATATTTTATTTSTTTTTTADDHFNWTTIVKQWGKSTNPKSGCILICYECSHHQIWMGACKKASPTCACRSHSNLMRQ